MIQIGEGAFREGKVVLLEPAFDQEELAELRGKLAAWEEDWNVPGMEAYDDYETRRRL
jgi:hypothetical protein